MLRGALALVALAASGCDGEPAPPGSGGAGGDSGAALSVTPYLYRAEGDGYVLLQPGGELELWAAPQGGRWARIGARVGGLGTDTAKLVARLIDATSGTVVVEASRTAPMVPAKDDPNLMQPDPTDMYHVVHLPLCPGVGGRPIAGVEYRLEVEVTELYGDFSAGTAALPVVPTCQEPPGLALEQCSCECGPDYAIGKCVGGG